uniref:NADH dehydrogenase subunit 6 n=1 Tax=Trichobilharzia regenti TaxID=157069 RepID=A7J1L6_TRIRE|nr:NADH dehydrogenase subunit 6 [Trichobilharzia regenti]ABG91505.1 NADH dehydrogenase subunit 6 [Trichobilharzia regenti]BAV82964.1 NADH dehydrogenase subunit 6 [Trichobilharzia regenti]
MLVNFLLFLYIVCSFMFIFSLGSLVRIFLIVVSSLVSSLVLYSIMGFSWYLLLFILVYVGGVYILFVYMSLVLPNVGLVNYRFSYLVGSFLIFLLFFCCMWISLCGGEVVVDNSIYLCNSFESFVYLFFCSVLLLGVILINFVVSSFNSWLR